MNHSLDRHLLLAWLPVLLWCALIFYLSGVPSLRTELPGGWDFLLRKFAHISEYAVLTFLFFRADRLSVSPRRALASAVLFAFAFALTDEYHQTFVSGRSGNLVDVSIDSLGIFLSVFLIDKRYLDASIRKSK